MRRRLTTLLSALAAVATLALAGAEPALAGPDTGWSPAVDIGYCNGGAATSAGNYTTNFANGATGRCDFRSPDTTGAGIRVSGVLFTYARTAACANGLGSKTAEFGHATGAMQLHLFNGCAGAGNYEYDVRGYNVVHAAVRAGGTTPNTAPLFMRFGSLHYRYEDLQGPSVTYHAFGADRGTPWATATDGSSWVVGSVAAWMGTTDNDFFRGNAGHYITNGGHSYEWGTPANGDLAVWLDPGPDGAHQLVSWRDGAGWARSQQVTGFNVDRTAPSAPTLSAGAYTPGTWSGAPVTITPASSDGAGSGIAEYRWDDGAVTPAARTISDSGTFTVRALARDRVGHVTAGHDSAYSSAMTVMVDQTAPGLPEITTGAYVPASWSNQEQVEVQISPGSDAHSGVAGTQYRTRHAPDGVGFGSWSAWVEGDQATVSAEGITEIQARTADNVDNVSAATAPVRIQLDRTPPPAPGRPEVSEVSPSGQPTIIWQAAGTDQPSGLAGYFVERTSVVLNPGAPLGGTLFTDTAPGPAPAYRIFSVDQAGNTTAHSAASDPESLGGVDEGDPVQVTLTRRVSAQSWGAEDLEEALCQLPSVRRPGGSDCPEDAASGPGWNAD